MNKLGIAAIAAVAALILGFGARLTAPTAHAEPTALASVGCEQLAGAIDGDTTDTTVAGDVVLACTGHLLPADIANLADAMGDEDGTLEADDLTDADALDGNQLGEGCTALGLYCTIQIFVFVNDESPVTFDVPAGLQTFENGTIDWVCAAEADDEDCDDTTPNNGDGVVTAALFNATGTAGQSKTTNVSQEDISESFDTTIVGTAHDVALAAVETTIETNGSTSAAAACQDDNDVADSSSITQPETTVVAATVTDSDGTEMTRVPVLIESDDEDVAVVATNDPSAGITGNTGITVDSGATGISAFAVICGGKTTGTANITATINDTLVNEDKDTVEMTVVGPPAAIALTADPAAIACDGSSTSTVTAKVTDSDGNNVANGTDVTFSVVALGTANPIQASTTDGSATSTITPLSQNIAGTTVVVSSGDVSNSIRVDCLLPTPTVPAGPTATPTGGGGGVTGPDTGTGGYLGQDGSAGFPLWTLIALALGSVALVTGSMVTRRAGK